MSVKALDLKDAYRQVPIDHESSLITTITTPFGLFQYNFLPFGLCTAPAIFQRVIDRITYDLEGVVVYQDDVVVHAATEAEHDIRLLELFRKFVKCNIQINPEIFYFKVDEFECLRFLVNGSGYKPDPNKIAALISLHSPRNIR